MTDPRPGLQISELSLDLHKVSPEFDAKPALTIDLLDRIGPEGRARYREDFEDDPIADHWQHLSLDTLSALSFDELSKLYYSCDIMMRQDVRAPFEDLDDEDCGRRRRAYEPRVMLGRPCHEMVRRIMVSHHNWGSMRRDRWNEVVDAYDGLRRFDLDVPGFTVEIDHTQHHHGKSHSKYTQTYLDGVFAYVIRWKGVHVMTLGFSFSKDRRLLIQQIQNRSKTGNRWMFRFPKDRVDHIVSRMMAAFPDHTVMLVDGADVARKNLDSYRQARLDTIATIGRHRRSLEREVDPEWRETYGEWLATAIASQEAIETQIAHLEGEIGRLEAFYRNTSHPRTGETFKTDGLRHYALARPDADLPIAA